MLLFKNFIKLLLPIQFKTMAAVTIPTKYIKIKKNDQKLYFLTIVALLILIIMPKTAYAQFDYNKLVPMDEYSQYSRVLDCYSCFMAGGRMCHDKNHASMFFTTYSSNKGNGICCKSKVPSKGICSGNDGKHICSMPSYDTSPKSQYKDVLSEDGRNHQMFAFCPML